MATTDSIPDLTPSPDSASAPASPRENAALLVMLATMPVEQLEGVIANLRVAFPPRSMLIATPEVLVADAYPGLDILPVLSAKPSVTLTAADFVTAHQLAEKHGARAILMLGQESGSLAISALRSLADAALSTPTDLAIPCYDLPPHTGLINSAILYPLTRSLFISSVRFPLAIDLGLSARMAERLARAAQRFATANQIESLVWPINEAAAAGFAVAEFNAGTRLLPQPTDPDINAILAHVTGSLFADIDAKAAFWQRARRPVASRNLLPPLPHTEPPADIAPMLEAFHLAYTNLREIWSLVLPPNSLLGLKRLSIADAAAFRMPENLWARIVYDFLLAFRLRTINRGHLLGALIPLYLAWVASHINITVSGSSSELHIEATAAAFEAEKPYLVSRWRWPDRFNP